MGLITKVVVALILIVVAMVLFTWWSRHRDHRQQLRQRASNLEEQAAWEQHLAKAREQAPAVRVDDERDATPRT